MGATGTRIAIWPGTVVLCLALLFGGLAHATPQWSLTITSDSADVGSNRFDQDSAALVIEPQALDPEQRTPAYVSFAFSNFKNPLPRMTRLAAGRKPSGALTPAALTPGTYSDVPASSLGSGSDLGFDAFMSTTHSSCPFSSTTFTVHAIEYADRLSAQDSGLGYIDLEFVSQCTTGAGPALVTGRFVYEDSQRRAPNLSIVRGTLWEDSNGNGLRDAGEPGIASGRVTPRWFPFPSAAGLTALTRLTDADGNYEFHLPAGDYDFQSAPPVSFLDAESQEMTVAPSPPDVGGDDSIDSDFQADGRGPRLLFGSGEVRGPDAGYVNALTTIEGHAWMDLNGDGIRDSNETVLPLTICFYKSDQLPLADKLLACVDGDESGYHHFETYRSTVYARSVGMPPFVGIALPRTLVDETLAGDYIVSLTPRKLLYTRGTRRSIVDVAGVRTTGTISGVVWDDSNHDGIRQAQEPRLAGVTMELWKDHMINAVTRITTDSEGRYTLNANAGDYYVQLLRPADPRFGEYIVSPRNIGSDSSVDSDFSADFLRSDYFTLAVGHDIANVDVGFAYPPLMPIRGHAWLDSNANGLRNAGEAPLPGAQVYVYRGTTQFANTVTDANGDYEVLAPLGFRYMVYISLAQIDGAVRLPTKVHVNGFNDSDLGYRAESFLLTRTAPVVRDIGFVETAREVVPLPEFLPLEVGSRWVFRTTDSGTQIVCAIARRVAVNGLSAAQFSCSDGQVFTFSEDSKGLRMHSLRLFGFARGLLFFNRLSAEIVPNTPIQLAYANRPPGTTLRKRATGRAKVSDGVHPLSSNVTLSYASSLTRGRTDAQGEFGPQLHLSHRFHALRNNAKPINLGFGMILARGVGPVAFYNPDNGAITARLDTFVRDSDKDGRSIQNDNCPAVKNVRQTDTDQDGVGDACDLDLDDDGVRNSADNCPSVWNEAQADSNSDGRGDACTPPS